MKKNIMYGFLLLVSIVLFTACGTDQKENPPQPDGPYSFVNASTPLKITKPTEVNGTIIGSDNNISVQLLEFGLVKAGASIQMLAFDNRYGVVSPMIDDTDEDGIVVFKYQAPLGRDYDAIRGQDITLQAVYLDDTSASTTTTTGPTAPKVLIEQDFVLQFR